MADSTVDASTASAFIISQMKAYNIEAKDAEGIVDKLNEVNKLAFE